MQVVRLSREADERALERFVHAHGLLGVVVDAALACRPAGLMRTRVRCVSAPSSDAVRGHSACALTLSAWSCVELRMLVQCMPVLGLICRAVHVPHASCVCIECTSAAFHISSMAHQQHSTKCCLCPIHTHATLTPFSIAYLFVLSF